MPAATSLPFPTLALLAIYHSITAVPSGERTERFDDTIVREDDLTIEARKVLYLHSVEPLSTQRRARLMGTVMGMANFARMLSAGGAPAVRSVYSTRQRMIWLEPEPGYFLHVTIDLPRLSRSHSRGASSATTASITRPTAPPALEDESILAALRDGYQQYKLIYGTLGHELEQGRREELMNRLEKYWSNWIMNWSLNKGETDGFDKVISGFELSPLQSSPITALINEFITSNPLTHPLLLHRHSILHLPPTSTPPYLIARGGSTPSLELTEDDLTAIVNHLCSIEPLSLPLSPPSTKAAKPRRSRTTVSTLSSSSSGLKAGWNSIVGVGDYLISSFNTVSSLPGVTALSNLSLFSVGAAPTKSRGEMMSLSDQLAQELREEQEERRVKEDKVRRKKLATASANESIGRSGIAWGLSGVSWSGLMGQSYKKVEQKVIERRPSLAQLATSMRVEASVDDAAVNAAIPSDPAAPADPPLVSSAVPLASPPVATETDSVDVAALSAALDVESLPALLIDGSNESNVTAVTDSIAEEEEDQLEPASLSIVYCGHDMIVEMRVIRHKSLIVALLSPSDTLEDESVLIASAYRLLKSIDSALVPPPLPIASFPHRYLIKTGLIRSLNGWTKQRWSGRSTIEENEISNALFESSRESYPAVLESFTRTAAGDWVISSRSNPTTKVSSDLYLVLAANTSKNGLVDAAEEFRKLRTRL